MDCNQHPGLPFLAICATCENVPVCLSCMMDSHNGHELIDANDIRTSLKEMEEADDKMLADLNSGITQAIDLRKQQEFANKNTKRLINEQRQLLHFTVDEMADNLLLEHETLAQKNCDMFNNAITAISNTIQKVKKHKMSVNHIDSDKDVLIHGTHWGSLVGVTEDLSCLTYDRPDQIDFIKGRINNEQLALMLGRTTNQMQKETDKNHFKLSLSSSFKHADSNYVNEMVVSSKGQTWLKTKDSCEIKLTNTTGDVTKTVSFDRMIHGMTLINDTTLLVCCPEKKDVKQVTLPQGNVSKAFSTGKLFPLCITNTVDGNLYLTLLDKNDYNITADSKRLLARYTPSGEETGRAQYDNFGHVIFVRPRRVKVSEKGDIIAVTNATDRDNTHLVILNNDMTLRLRYLEYGKVVPGTDNMNIVDYIPNEMFAVRGIEFDPNDNIIVCEHYTKSVILLTPDGVVIRTLTSTQLTPTKLTPTHECVPISVVINKDDLWIGCQDGTIQIYKVDL